ncbi:AraC family transcriptional regulator [Dysgonomonas sp. Marseille-P4677]|uniref:helix-turn-helix domain-containing protein n=1 Tax=Dysgonomonas sp. Marseille-P4677 TaxID=2364790 RepID=UPI00191476ED|nr:helix-turn-helix domain-containing protein [Dysgonomonas sp. Marseille-P4677]MBK5720936.1 AraC family transcriptional regulator [Dysgonomonas sp. Marseille-P4677]
MDRDNINNFSQNIPLDGLSVIDNVKAPIDFLVNQPYIIDGLLIALVEYGESKLTINFKEYTTSKNTVLVIHNQSIIEILDLAENRKVKAFFISTDLLFEEHFFADYEVFSKLSKYSFFTVDDKTMEDLLHFYNFISNQQNNINMQFQAEINKYLTYAFCFRIKSIYKNLNIINTSIQKTRNEIIVDNFFILLFDHYIEERNISFYADKLCVSAKHLSFIVKKVLGKPCHHWINQMIIYQAKFKLKTSEISIKEISDQLNFITPSQFGRFFKQYTGLTPLQYRLM